MSQPLVMPKLGLTMTEGQVAEWRRAPGEPFAAGDVLVVIETDKIANEVEAPAAGRLLEIVVPAGQTAPVGATLARWEPADGAIIPAPAAEVKPAADAAPDARVAIETAAAPASPAAAKTAARSGGRRIATPYARRLARERGLSLEGIAGSGPGGRIRAADVPLCAAKPAPAVAPPVAASAEHFLLAEVPAAALLDWHARLPAGQGGVGGLVFYLAARVLLASHPQALCRAGDGAPRPAAQASQGFAAWRATGAQARAGAEPAVTLHFESAGRGPLRLYAPARPAGCALALGLGSLVAGAFTLALRADASAWSVTDAAAFLTRLHAALEDPRRVLL
ncbi:biotin/lipoyl-containing protein [Immundisolibacter sp.]|uniref:biotin/lipoyl-containing protein n=1 Tax=Immundisolibacter sp. TaxID=1934948 RepID=UPI0026189117|nr:biotin/lipoyl-containing protein [Immundisolibacter sp.]MDD3652353.1 E3 binding domain-containing protein [Immundisolibacter sp.]